MRGGDVTAGYGYAPSSGDDRWMPSCVDYPVYFFLPVPARAMRPEPKRSMVAGSGTGVDAGLILKVASAPNVAWRPSISNVMLSDVKPKSVTKPFQMLLAAARLNPVIGISNPVKVAALS